MKKIFLYMYMLIIITFLVSCNDSKEENKTTSIEYETGFYGELSDEQIKYLEDKLFETKESLNGYSYNKINSLLFGTGIELYNQTSGFENNGVTYSYNTNVDSGLYGNYYRNLVSDSNVRITLEEAYTLREKDMELRLDDFLCYEFFMNKNYSEETYLVLPIAELENCYICVKFIENEDGTIHMYSPCFTYDDTNGDNIKGKYKLLMYKGYIESLINDFPAYSTKKLMSYIYYESITNHSLMISIDNFSEKDYIVNETRKLYKLVDGEYIELTNLSIKSDYEFVIEAGNVISITIPLCDKNSPLESGDYKFAMGIDKSGCFYKEFKFTIQ